VASFALDLEDFARRSPLLGTGADRFRYVLIVTEGTRDHRVVTSETGLSASPRALMEHVLRGEAPRAHVVGEKPNTGRSEN